MYDKTLTGDAFFRKYRNDSRTQAIFKRASDNMAKRGEHASFQKSDDAPSMERILAVLAALSSKIDAIEGEIGVDEVGLGSKKETKQEHRERQVATLDDDDEDVAEDVKAAMQKFNRHGTRTAAASTMRRLHEGTLRPVAKQSDFHKAVDKAFGVLVEKNATSLQRRNPRLSRADAVKAATRTTKRTDAMRMARQGAMSAFKRFQAA